MKTSIASETALPIGKIRFQEVTKTFERNGETFVAVDRLSFAVNDGEFVSILGPSGCGKTTLISMVAGFARPDNGRVCVDGSDVTDPSPSRGVVFQQYAIFPWLTVAENIAFGLNLKANRRYAPEINEIVTRYVTLMGLQGFEKSLPKTLSGGMKQRVAIARASACNPDILLLDEPFAALDSQTREFMQELLQSIQLTERKTAMFVTHSVEEAIFLSNRIVVLNGRPGRIDEIVTVDLPTPRPPDTRLNSRFIELRRHIERMMRSESKH